MTAAEREGGLALSCQPPCLRQDNSRPTARQFSGEMVKTGLAGLEAIHHTPTLLAPRDTRAISRPSLTTASQLPLSIRVGHGDILGDRFRDTPGIERLRPL